MRLFAAVVPPADVVAHLAARVQPLRDGQLSWSDSSTWHITLAFYGEVEDARVPELTQRLIRAARRHEELSLLFGGAGRFGSAVLWVGVRGDVQRLRRLAESAIAAGRRMGIDRIPAGPSGHTSRSRAHPETTTCGRWRRLYRTMPGRPGKRPTSPLSALICGPVPEAGLGTNRSPGFRSAHPAPALEQTVQDSIRVP